MHADERALDMIERREAGQTLAQIGRAHGLSRQRVCQILSGWMDVEQRAGVKRLRHEQSSAFRRAQRIRWRKDPYAYAWRFWSNTADPDERGCRVWTGLIAPTGYGRWNSGLRMCEKFGFKPTEYAHQLAWLLTHGEIEGRGRGAGRINVLHRCDVPACCEPSHLFLGTPADNMRDRDAKGRTGKAMMPEGQRLRWASYSPERRAEVIRAAAEGRRQAKSFPPNRRPM